jgi:hypothetical protein
MSSLQKLSPNCLQCCLPALFNISDILVREVLIHTILKTLKPDILHPLPFLLESCFVLSHMAKIVDNLANIVLLGKLLEAIGEEDILNIIVVIS